MGTNQFFVDFSTGNPQQGMDPASVLSSVTHAKDTNCILTVEWLNEIRPKDPSASFQGTGFTVTHGPELGVNLPPDCTTTTSSSHLVAPAAQQEGIVWYRDGLNEFGTRNDAMFKVALVVVNSPQILVPLGYDPEKDEASQLFEWISNKHNGYSNDFPGKEDANLGFWRLECVRVIESARESPLCHPYGIYLLSEMEWEFVFQVGDTASKEKGFRYRLESYAANVLRKAKASVLRKGSVPDPDGTYSAEISSEWFRKIPFGKGTHQRNKYQSALREAGLLKLVKRGSKEAKRANIYSGFPLDLYGPRPTLPYSPPEMGQIASARETESPLIEYVLVVNQRYSEKEQRERYGGAGAGFFRSWERRIDQVASLLSRVRFEVVAGYDQGHVWVVRSEDTGEDPGEMENAA
jgi:hypothetical protein